MTYLVNDVFYTLQGEGFWTGRPAVFCRFSKCNLWTGREEDRAKAICKFCDTTFLDYTPYDLRGLVKKIISAWPTDDQLAEPMVVFTGGEPTLQLTGELVQELHRYGFYVAIETNGTRPVPDNVDWVCVSPKTPKVRVTKGDELKLVYPQLKILPHLFQHLAFDHFWLSPMDGPDLEENIDFAVRYVLEHPKWRLNTQMHKRIGVK